MRQCRFCDEVAATREHAWPRWLLRLFPGTDRGVIEAERSGQAIRSWTAGNGLQVKSVCADCNNGWMSRLESDAKPLVEKLLTNERLDIELPAASVLAAWALKSAMLFESFTPERQSFYTGRERRAMRVIQALPDRTSVWLARCHDHTGLFVAGVRLRGRHNDDEISGLATTMVFGSLVVQSLTVRLPESLAAFPDYSVAMSDGPWTKATTPLWPPDTNHQRWPPDYVLNGKSGVEALLQRFKPVDTSHNERAAQ